MLAFFLPSACAVTVGDELELPCNALRGLQTSAARFFKDGRSVLDLARMLWSNPRSFSTIPPIETVLCMGVLIALDHRRLVAAILASLAGNAIIRVRIAIVGIVDGPFCSLDALVDRLAVHAPLHAASRVASHILWKGFGLRYTSGFRFGGITLLYCVDRDLSDWYDFNMGCWMRPRDTYARARVLSDLVFRIS